MANPNQNSRTVVTGAIVLAIALLIGGCGQRGPLYLPSPEQARESAKTQAIDTGKSTNKRRESGPK